MGDTNTTNNITNNIENNSYLIESNSVQVGNIGLISNESKVFGIGRGKTGTSTLGKALKILGYKVIGYSADLFHQYQETKNITNAMIISENFNGFRDRPWTDISAEIWSTKYPNAKFIITDRNDKEWISSYQKYFGHLNMTQKNKLLKRKHLHYSQIRNFFRNKPHKALFINTSNGALEYNWKSICKFLNKPIPKEKFPFANVGTDRIFCLGMCSKSNSRMGTKYNITLQLFSILRLKIAPNFGNMSNMSHALSLAQNYDVLMKGPWNNRNLRDILQRYPRAKFLILDTGSYKKNIPRRHKRKVLFMDKIVKLNNERLKWKHVGMILSRSTERFGPFPN